MNITVTTPTIDEIYYPYDVDNIIRLFLEDPALAAKEILRLQRHYGLSSWDPLTDRIKALPLGEIYWRLQFNIVLLELQRINARYGDLEKATFLHFKLGQL